jgi:predicted RecB family nuclease
MTARLLTPSKITAFLDCAHSLTLQNLVDDRKLTVQHTFGEFAQLLLDKGIAHEQACLDAYRAQGFTVFEPSPWNKGVESFAAWTARVGNPFSDDIDVVYQMPFIHEGVRGIADFVVRRVDDEGISRWEPVDAKLARNEAKPGHVLQLCFYAEALEALTGTAPELLKVWLGRGQFETVRLTDVQAYWRRLRRQLATLLDADEPADTAPVKCNHCQFCAFEQTCEAVWREQDSLQFVAGILKADRERLTTADVPTMAALAAHDGHVDGVRPERLERLVRQAVLQVQRRDAGEESVPPIEHLPVAADAGPVGFAALPEPDDGDVFLDYEGHPFWRADGGLFFLFGYLVKEADGEWQYVARWAHDEDDERDLTRSFISWLANRRAAHPGMHVYHYNHTERSALWGLASEYGVELATLQQLIDTGLFVDLFTVITQSMQVGVESYGLKKIEQLAGFERRQDITRGAGAVVEYEKWCADKDRARLDAIAAYNEDDVLATLALRDWLIEQRPADSDWRVAQVEPPEETYPDIDEQVERLHAFGAGTPEHLLGDLLGYWLRERRAVFADMIAKTLYEPTAQLDNADVIAGLEFVDMVTPTGKNGNPLKERAQFRFPEQTVGRKLRDPGATVIFSVGAEQLVIAGVSALDLDQRLVELAWGDRARELDVHPTVVVLDSWVDPKDKPHSLSNMAQRVLDGVEDATAAMALLRRELPRFQAGCGPTDGQLTDDIDDLRRWVHDLDHSCLAVQGPPGTGKTFTGSHLVYELVTQGKRVGLTAMSHAAVENLLAGVLEVFDEHGGLNGKRVVRKGDKPDDPDPRVKYVSGNDKSPFPDYDIVGGTTWLFSRPEWVDQPLDVLVIDEAGQLALADALAAAPAAKNVILLGDPLQLAQVTQGSHPDGSGASVLEHVLGEHATIPADRGVFLSRTWRMHPKVCDFISEYIYEGRLITEAGCALQGTEFGTGLRWLRAEHCDRDTECEEEAELIATEIRRLIGSKYTDRKGASHEMTVDDILVVAPYNDQVALIRDRLNGDPRTAGVRVGTVDKFQGQEAPVVFFSMTASTAADVPRGLDFLFSRNRLNVAISRAKMLAYVVCTEELLDSRAKSVNEMKLISTLCAFAERC